MPLFRSVVSISVCALLVVPSARSNDVRQQGSTRTPSTAAADFEQARALLSADSIDPALAAVRRGLAHSPRSVEGLNLLGLIYHRQHRYDDAVSAFQAALAIDPRSTETLNNLANSYATAGKRQLAQQTFRKSLRIDPQNRTANYNFGLLLLSEHQPHDAIAKLEAVKPPDSSTLLALTEAYLGAGLMARGLSTAERLSGNAGQDVKLHFSLGVLLAAQKQYRPAIREFEVANALQPRTAEVLHNLGLAYLRNHNAARAQAVLQEAADLQPDSADILLLLAQSKADQRKDVDALELLVRARKLAPQNTAVLLLMARLSMKQSFYEDAIEILDNALKIEPRRPELHAALGESYFTIGQVDKALAEFNTLLALDPSAQAYAYLGLSYRHLGRFDEAKRFLSDGLRIDDNDPLILFNLGWIAKRQGDDADAEQYFARAVRFDPSYADALLEFGTLKMNQKKYEEAIPLLRRCADVDPHPAQAYYKLAIAERNLHQIEASQRDMKVFQTLSKNPEPAPYPLQHFFAYVQRREALSPEQKAEVDVRELEAEAKQHPDRPRSLYLLAEAYLKVGRVDDALKAVERLDALSGGDFRTALGEGVLLARFRLYPAAIQHFEAALAANPSSDEAAYDLAAAYSQTREYSKALQALQRLSPGARKANDYLVLLADVALHQGRIADAIGALGQAITNSPDNDEYYVSLALAQLQAGDADEAYATVQRGLLRVPDSGRLYWGLGVTSVARGDDSQAEAYLKKAMELMPSSESAVLALGMFYYQAGRIADAREMLDRYTAVFPQPSMDVSKIRETLAGAPSGLDRGLKGAKLSPDARRQFCELAVSLAASGR
jgi:tetratricopeptide (TPR) repeat protein